jgi:hypothetical protein
MALAGTLQAKTITCDFEQALLNAACEAFGDVPIIGCLFHFKQAIRRKLIKHYKLPEAVVTKLIGADGLMNLLTTIPICDIQKYGIPFIRSQMAEEESQYGNVLNEFWKYFVNTWMRRYCPTFWNITGITARGLNLQDTVINRTNNALERYNRTMNHRFPNAHPSMVDFVVALRSEGCHYVQHLRFIEEGKIQPTPHSAVTTYPIPPAYLAYRLNHSTNNTSTSTSAMNYSAPASAPTSMFVPQQPHTAMETQPEVLRSSNNSIRSSKKRSRSSAVVEVPTRNIVMSPIFESEYEESTPFAATAAAEKDVPTTELNYDSDCNSVSSVSSNTSRSGRPIKVTRTMQQSGYSIIGRW